MGAAPSPRTGATATVLPGGRYILIAGGWDPDNTGGRASSSTAAAAAAAAAASHTGRAAGGSGRKPLQADAAPPVFGAAGSKRKRGVGIAAGDDDALCEEPEAVAGRPFGDVYLLDTFDWEWLAVSTAPAGAATGAALGSALLARVGHAAVPLQLHGSKSSSPAVALIGGVRGGDAAAARCNDVAILTLPHALLAASGVAAAVAGSSCGSGSHAGGRCEADLLVDGGDNDSDNGRGGLSMAQPEPEPEGAAVMSLAAAVGAPT